MTGLKTPLLGPPNNNNSDLIESINTRAIQNDRWTKSLPTLASIHPSSNTINIQATRIGADKKDTDPYIQILETPDPVTHTPNKLPAIFYKMMRQGKPTGDFALEHNELVKLLQKITYNLISKNIKELVNEAKIIINPNNKEHITDTRQLSQDETCLYLDAIADPDNNEELKLIVGNIEDGKIYYFMPFDIAFHFIRVLTKLPEDIQIYYPGADLKAVKVEGAVPPLPPTTHQDNLPNARVPLIPQDQLTNEMPFAYSRKRPEKKERFAFTLPEQPPHSHKWISWEKRNRILEAFENRSGRFPASSWQIICHLAKPALWKLSLLCKVFTTYSQTLTLLLLFYHKVLQQDKANETVNLAFQMLAALDAFQTFFARILKDMNAEHIIFTKWDHIKAGTDPQKQQQSKQTNYWHNVFNGGVVLAATAQAWFNYGYLSVTHPFNSSLALIILIDIGSTITFLRFRLGIQRYQQFCNFFISMMKIIKSHIYMAKVIAQSPKHFYKITTGFFGIFLQFYITNLNIEITNSSANRGLATAIMVLFTLVITLPSVSPSFDGINYNNERKIDWLGFLGFLGLVSIILTMSIYTDNIMIFPNMLAYLAGLVTSIALIVISICYIQQPFFKPANCPKILNEAPTDFHLKMKMSGNFWEKLLFTNQIYYTLVPGPRPKFGSLFAVALDALNSVDIFTAVITSIIALPEKSIYAITILCIYSNFFNFMMFREINPDTNRDTREWEKKIETLLITITKEHNFTPGIQDVFGRRVIKKILRNLETHHKYPANTIADTLIKRYIQAEEAATPEQDLEQPIEETPNTQIITAWLLALYIVSIKDDNRVHKPTSRAKNCFYQDTYNGRIYSKPQVQHAIDSGPIISAIAQEAAQKLLDMGAKPDPTLSTERSRVWADMAAEEYKASPPSPDNCGSTY